MKKGQLAELESANSLDTYLVLFASGQSQKLTRNSLLHNYINNSINCNAVISFEKAPALAESATHCANCGRFQKPTAERRTINDRVFVCSDTCKNAYIAYWELAK